MIRDILLPRLEDRFPGRGLRPGFPPDPVAIFPRQHEAVGDVSIWDHGDEATVAVGEITHGHFNPYDPTLNAEQIAERVADDVINFLIDLFEDRVLLWKSADGRSGGWRMIGSDDRDSLMDASDQGFVWSGRSGILSREALANLEMPRMDHLPSLRSVSRSLAAFIWGYRLSRGDEGLEIVSGGLAHEMHNPLNFIKNARSGHGAGDREHRDQPGRRRGAGPSPAGCTAGRAA